MNNLPQKAKEFFLSHLTDETADIGEHVIEAGRLAEDLIKNFPDADQTILLTAVWLHDTGYFSGNKEVDHAVTGEEVARHFLDGLKIEKGLEGEILHCIRAHRNREISARSLEAKLLICIDKSSHMTESLYFRWLRGGKKYSQIFDKLERDFASLGLIPEIQQRMQPLYDDWKRLLKHLKEIRDEN